MWVTSNGSIVNHKISVNHLRVRMSKTDGWRVRVHRFFVNYVTCLRDNLPPWRCWINPQMAGHMILEKQIKMILNGWFFFQMFLMQHKFTKDSPPMHKGCTTDAPWMHHGCTKYKHQGWTLDAPLMLFESTTDALRIHSHLLRMHQECLTRAPQMHFEHTMGAPGMPHLCFRMRLEHYLDVQWML